MRVPVIAGNWKMFKTVQEAVTFSTAIQPLVKDATNVTIVIGPPFTAINAAAQAVRGSNVAVASSNVNAALNWSRYVAAGTLDADMDGMTQPKPVPHPCPMERRLLTRCCDLALYLGYCSDGSAGWRVWRRGCDPCPRTAADRRRDESALERSGQRAA